MYGASGNIALILDTFEKVFKMKGTKGAIEDVYALLRGFLTQLEVYQTFTVDVATPLCYKETLVVSLFLNSIQFYISSQI